MQTTVMNTKARRTGIRCPMGLARLSSHVRLSWFEDKGSSALPFIDCLPPVDTADVWQVLCEVTHTPQGDSCPFLFLWFLVPGKGLGRGLPAGGVNLSALGRIQ